MINQLFVKPDMKATKWYQGSRCVDIAIMAHNTTNHDSFKCSPIDIPQMSVIQLLDLQFENPEKQPEPKGKDMKEIFDKMNFVLRETSEKNTTTQ